MSDLLREAWVREALWHSPELGLETLIDPRVASARRAWLLERCAEQFVRARMKRAMPKRAVPKAAASNRVPLEGPVALTPLMQAFALDLFNSAALQPLARNGDVGLLLKATDPSGRRSWLIDRCVRAFQRARYLHVMPLRVSEEAERRHDWPPAGIEMLEASGYEIKDEGVIMHRGPDRFDPACYTTEGLRWVHFAYQEDPRIMLERLGKKGLKPASIEHLLAYGAVTPRRYRKRHILLLSAWGMGFHRCPAYLYSENQGLLRALPCGVWSEGCRKEVRRLSNPFPGAHKNGYWTPAIAL